MNKWTIKILRWPPLYRLLTASRNMTLPGLEGLTLWQVMRFFLVGIFKGQITTRAAAVCFNILLAVPPTIIVLISLVPFIPVRNFNERLLSYLADFLPAEAALTISEVYLDLMKREHTAFLSVSFILALYYASNSMRSVLDGFSRSVWMIKRLSGVRQHVMSLGLLFVFTFLMALAMASISLSGVFIDFLAKADLFNREFLGWGINTIKWIILFLLFTVIISTLYNVGNPSRHRWRVFSPGSLIATFGVIIVSLGFAYYVNNFANYNKIYGSVGTILVLMLWLYFNIVVLLIGFELNASIVHIKGSGKVKIKERRVRKSE